MSTRKVFERTDARHETPPSAVCGRPHVAVLKSDQLPLAGGGSLPAPDTCRPLSREYINEFFSLDTPDEIEASLGLHLDELVALSREDMHALAREKPLEIIALLGAHGLGSLIYSLFPADVEIMFFGRVFGIDPAPFLALNPDDGVAAFRERIEGFVSFNVQCGLLGFTGDRALASC